MSISDTRELAQTLYTRWASMMDRTEPINQTVEEYSTSQVRTVTIDRTTTRPKWHSLTIPQQDVWFNIAKYVVQSQS